MRSSTAALTRDRRAPLARPLILKCSLYVRTRYVTNVNAEFKNKAKDARGIVVVWTASAVIQSMRFAAHAEVRGC